MKNLLIIAAIIAFTATLSSCNDEYRTGPEPRDFYKITNESGHKLTIVNNSDPIREPTFEEPVVLENDEFIEWKHVDSALGMPIRIRYENGDRIEYYFDDEYKIFFMADEYHRYNIACLGPYKWEKTGPDSSSYTCVITEEMYDYAVYLNELGLVYAGSEDPNFVLPPQYEEKSDNGI